ncbi:PLP-dependent transferase, partial [Stenotrophomonas geniculata]|uniref:PLP-dependent transferase n=1 Tax=Stenotrophomonas geniculata TaxID=86188 RepID=UPI003BF7DB39
MTKKSNYSIPTQLIYGKFETDKWDYSNHIIPPMTLSSSFRLHSAERGAEAFSQFGEINPHDPQYFYQRMGEPNKDMLEESLAIAEGGECCLTFASGMGGCDVSSNFFL